MKPTQTIPETFLGIGYTSDRAGLPLAAVRVPVPQPAADQVLIRFAASSLNPLEYKLADLNFMGRTPPVVLGLDIAGIVVSVGDDVRDIAFRDAAVLPMCFLSAFAGLYGTVQANDTVYIPGGGGGVGHLAVQMAARVLGAGLVISSGSTPQSMELSHQCGANHVFNYKHDNIVAEIAK